MTGGKKLYWPGRHNLGPWWQFQEIYQPGETTGAHVTGALGQDVNICPTYENTVKLRKKHFRTGQL